jgi:hypothetical protein
MTILSFKGTKFSDAHKASGKLSEAYFRLLDNHHINTSRDMMENREPYRKPQPNFLRVGLMVSPRYIM